MNKRWNLTPASPAIAITIKAGSIIKPMKLFGKPNIVAYELFATVAQLMIILMLHPNWALGFLAISNASIESIRAAIRLIIAATSIVVKIQRLSRKSLSLWVKNSIILLNISTYLTDCWQW